MEIYEIAALVILIISVIVFIIKMLRDEKETVVEWLVYAVTEAEEKLGSGTGRLKLKMVYDMFIRRFPAVSVFVSLDTFTRWVDIALDNMRVLISFKKNNSTEGVNGEN